jgi:hypothetical protein
LTEPSRLPFRFITRPALDAASLLFSLAMLASLLPPVHIPSVLQIGYYVVVPGYSLLRLVNYQTGTLDRVALVVVISLGVTVGLSALFQAFYPNGAVNQSLPIPLVALIASALSLRTSVRQGRD